MAKSLRGFGWFICGVLVAPPCYLVSSWVAAERARVESLERAIVATKREIRELETEFQTRANLAQLERWNGQVLSLAAPRPDQYVAGEEALARLHLPQPGRAAMLPASYIVPAGMYDNSLRTTPPPEAVPAPLPAQAPAPAPAPVPAPTKRAASPVAFAAVSVPSPAQAAPMPAARKAAVRKREAVASLDDTLLSDRTLGDLARGAKSETGRRR